MNALKIENEENEEIKDEMLTIVNNLKNNLNELFFINDYINCKALSGKLNDICNKFKKKLKNIEDYVGFIKDIDELLSNTKFEKDEILINLNENKKIIKEK